MERRCLAGLWVWLATIVLAPAQARASCDVIPPAARTFGSTLGSVDRAIAGPRDWVRITVNPSCPIPTGISIPPRSVFKDGDQVTIRWDASLLGGTSTDAVERTVVSQDVEVDAADTHRLRFRVPTTARTTYQPQGLAGPVRITVKTPANEVVAQIDALSQPTTGCDRYPDEIFGNFTILPEDNDYDLKESKDDFINMTLDGNRDLLIPFRYARVPVSSRGPVAFVQRGYGSFASGVGGKTIGDSLVSAIAAGEAESFLVRPYSSEGYPLPPVVGIDDQGSLFGTVDGDRSVLRIARVGSGGQQVHDLVSMLNQVKDDAGVGLKGIGPITIQNGFARRFRVYRCGRPVLLSGLKAGSRVAAFGVDEGFTDVGDLNGDGDDLDVVPDIISRADAGSRCATSTKIAAAEEVVHAANRTLLDVHENLTAFVDADKGTMHVFRGRNRELTTSGTTTKVNVAPVANGRPLAVGGSSVFFGKEPSTTGLSTVPPILQVFDASASPPTLHQLGTTPGVVAVDPGSGSAVMLTATTAAQFYDGTLHGLTYQATHAALLDDVVAITVPESASPPPPGNGDGDTNDEILMVTSDATAAAPLAATSPPASARAVTVTKLSKPGPPQYRVLFVTAEADEGTTCAGKVGTTPSAPCDLNGDGNADDLVLRVYDPATQITTAIQAVVAADDFVVDGSVVAFRTKEIVLSGSQVYRFDAPVMTAYDLDQNRLVRTNLPALRCDEPGYEWMQPYAVRGRDVFFLGPQTCGDPFGRELIVVNIDSFAYQPLSASMSSLPSAVTVTAITGAPAVEVHPAGGAVPMLYADTDGDGIFDGFDRCNRPDLSYFDDDLDGIGTDCDPNLCGAARAIDLHLPSGGQALAANERLAIAAGNYANARLAATTACLSHAVQHGAIPPVGAGPTDRCRGYFVGTSEVPPSDPTAAKRIAQARGAFLSNVCTGCGGVDRAQAERVLQRYAEVAISLSHAGFGDDERKISAPCATQLTTAVNLTLKQMLDRLNGELHTHAPVVSLGSIGPAGVDIPGQDPLAVPAPTACAPDELKRVGACGEDPSTTISCLECVGFRQVSDALTTVY